MPSVSKQKGNSQSPTQSAKLTPTTPIQTSRSRGLERFASAWDVTDKVKMLLYGRSGTGKTTLASTFPGSILWLVCSGGKQPGELKSIDTPEMRQKIDAKIVSSIADMNDLLKIAAEGFATVVLDHATGLQDLTLREILGVEELPAQKGWGTASQQQWGQSGAQCKEILRALLGLNTHVVVIAQERTFGGEETSDVIAPTVGAAMTPSVTGWLGPACDYVVRTCILPRMQNKTTKVGDKEIVTRQRVSGVDYALQVGPSDVYITKFRTPKGTALPEYLLDPSYSKVLALIEGRKG